MGGLEQRSLKREPRKPARSTNALGNKQSWELKQKERDRIRRIRVKSHQIKAEIKEEQRRAAEGRKANRQRKFENEAKNRVVQEIRNTRAVKKLSPKNRKKAGIFMRHELNKM